MEAIGTTTATIARASVVATTIALASATVAIKSKVKINHPKMGDTSGLLTIQGRKHASNATSLDT